MPPHFTCGDLRQLANCPPLERRLSRPESFYFNSEIKLFRAERRLDLTVRSLLDGARADGEDFQPD
jgi:hypothetical protein